MMHPAIIGPAILHHLKLGTPVQRIVVAFTYGQLHQLFSDTISSWYPLEITLAEGLDMERKIDCRLFEVPWPIDIRTDKQRQNANRAKAQPAPTATPPAEPTDPTIQAVIADLFLEPYDRSLREYQQSMTVLRHGQIRQEIHRRLDQERLEGMAHE